MPSEEFGSGTHHVPKDSRLARLLRVMALPPLAVGFPIMFAAVYKSAAPWEVAWTLAVETQIAGLWLSIGGMALLGYAKLATEEGNK